MAAKPLIWMKRWLLAAAAYNVFWAALVVFWPTQTMSLLGIPKTTPYLWQCIGMIVGVYGIGYLIAAFNPLRHWPIIFVGLLGKVLGPIGFVAGLVAGDIPLRLGLTLLTNDLLWWAPFAMMLWAAYRFHARGGDVSQAKPVEIEA